MRHSLVSALAVLLSAAAALPQAPFTLRQVLSSPFPSELTSSPDGRRVAWFANDHGKRNLWGAEAPMFVPRQLTYFNEDDGQALSELQWSPDGEAILFVRGEGENAEGDVPNPTSDPAGAEQLIWAVPFSQGPPRILGTGTGATVSPAGQVAFVRHGEIWSAPLSASAPAHRLFRARGRNGSPAWSPDGKTLAFISDRGDHSYIGLYRPSGNTLRYLAPSVDRDHSPRWAPDGARIAFVRQPGRGGDPVPPGADVPNPWSIWVADSGSLQARQVWESGAALDASFPRILGDNVLQWGGGGRLVFASEQDGWMHLYSLPAAGGTPVLLTPGECEVEDVAWPGDRAYLVFSSNCRDIDRRHLWRVSVGGGAAEPLTSGDSIEWNPAVLPDGSVVFLRSDARLPAAPHILSSGKIRALVPSWIPREFPAQALVAPQPVEFKSPDGLTIHAQLFLPAQKPAAVLPAVIFMHGGPVRQMLLGWHYRYYYHNAYAFNQYLASRGYAVLSVNFRSGIGYGRAFREAPGRGARGATEYQDIVAAGHYLRSRRDIDPARIGLWGGSYGGYLTALGLARNSDLFAAGFDLHGVHDWSTRQFRSWAGTEAAEALRTAREASPVASVGTWKSPVLLVHGDDDRNVDFSQTVDLVQRLRAQNVPFEQLVYPDEVHDFLLHRHWIEAYEAGAEFFDRYLKKEPRP